MKVLAEHIFSSSVSPITGSYNSNLTLAGNLITQYSGSASTDTYISSVKSAIANQFELAGATYHMPHVIPRPNGIFWIIVASNASAGVTRNIGLYEFNSNSGNIFWRGFITLSGTTFNGSKTIRGIRGFLYSHTTGTVGTSGTSSTITGTSTQFNTEGISVGSRIGFGSSNPSDISTWYDITAINSDTELVIAAPVNITPGTNYIIEEMRILIGASNATVANGGTFLIKGINYGTFTFGGTVIPEATTVDNIRASYLLRSKEPATFTVTIASPGVFTSTSHGFSANDPICFTTTGTIPTGILITGVYFVSATGLTANTFRISATPGGASINLTGAQSGVHTVYSAKIAAPIGLASDEQIDTTTHTVYVPGLETTTLIRISKLNIRAPLTVTDGYTTSATELTTGTNIITGTAGIINNSRLFTVNHGTASGIKSVWIVTTTRIYRCTVSDITDGSTSYLSDYMIEIPPGTSSTNLLLNAMSQIDYSSTLDRLLIPTTTNRLGIYCGEYDTTGLIPFERIFGGNINRIRTSATNQGAADGFFATALYTIWSDSGYLFASTGGTTTGTNLLHVIPIGIESTYADYSNQKIITPEIATPNCIQFNKVYVQNTVYRGTYDLGFQEEPYRIYYRTSGISDNSGTWYELPQSGDISNIAPANSIQFAITLGIMGMTCIPARIFSIGCTYEDSSQDYHYEPSLTKSSAQNSSIAWKQIARWYGNIPDMRIRLFNDATGFAVIDDTVNLSASGTWQYSTDGNTWLSWDNTQDTVGNYIRYVGTSLPSGITVRAILTQV